MLELWQEVETGNEHDFSCACQLLSLNKTFRVFSGQLLCADQFKQGR